MSPLRRDRLPVTIITGALGAGKTTLVNATLGAHHETSVAIVVNEFGDVGIDGDLIVSAPDTETVQLASGCACCATRADLAIELIRLAGRVPRPDHILIETSGLADPGPIIDTVADLAAALMLNAVVTVADARTLPDALDLVPYETDQQLALAGTIVLTRIQDADSRQYDRTLERIRARNPHADIMLPDDAADRLLGLDSYRPSGAPAHDPGSPHGHAHCDAICIEAPGALDARRFAEWLSLVRRLKGPDIFRIKGVLALQGRPVRTLVHGVHGYIDVQAGAPWAGTPPASKLVVIGRELNQSTWRRALDELAEDPVAEREPAFSMARRP